MTASDPGNPPVTAGDGGMSNKNQHWGSTLDDFLHEEGIYGAAKAKAVKLEQLRQDIRDGLNSGDPTPWGSEEIKREGRKRRADQANTDHEA